MQKRFFIIPFPVWGNAWITMWKFLRWQWMSGAVAASIHPASLHRSPVCFLLKRTLSWASAWEFFFFFSVLSFEQPAVSSAPNVPNFNGDTKKKKKKNTEKSHCPRSQKILHFLFPREKVLYSNWETNTQSVEYICSWRSSSGCRGDVDAWSDDCIVFIPK